MAARTNKPEHDEATKDAIRASQLLNVLINHSTSKTGKLSASRIAAARAALPFLRPTLQAVEQTNVSPDDALTEDQIFNKLAALVQAHPDLLQRLLAVQAQAQPGVAAVELSTYRGAIDAPQHENNAAENEQDQHKQRLAG